MANQHQVDFIRGGTRMFGIIGDPIDQVRSPEMVTWAFHQRGIDAVVVPLHVRSAEFERVMPALMRLANFGGFILTVPFKARALRFADRLGSQGALLGGINQLVRRADGGWSGDMFDGMGCVAAFTHRGIAIRGKRMMLIGLGGAGSAIAIAMAGEKPALMRIHDLEAERTIRVKAQIEQISPDTLVEVGPPSVEGMDLLLNATPVGMLGDPRLPIDTRTLPAQLVVFDAITKPEDTPLLSLAQACGCQILRGREMMLGQIARLVDGFLDPGSVGDPRLQAPPASPFKDQTPPIAN
jgi:shikimate dehydrogenase